MDAMEIETDISSDDWLKSRLTHCLLVEMDHWLNSEITAECNALPLAFTRNQQCENAVQYIASKHELA